MSVATRFPPAVDTIVAGAGTAGAVVAGRLAAGSSGRTLLLEAGPDYGPAGSGRWPHELLDATSSAQWSHDWGYAGEFGGRVVHFNRARVLGGCSAHNAGAVVFGSRLDYDGWAAELARIAPIVRPLRGAGRVEKVARPAAATGRPVIRPGFQQQRAPGASRREAASHHRTGCSSADNNSVHRRGEAGHDAHTPPSPLR